MAPDDGTLESWLRACHGFRLEVDGRRVGIVEDVLYGDGPSPAALVVRGGLFGTEMTIVAAADVLHVAPRSKRVVARGSRADAPD